jgi:hypothetical protein
MTTIAYKQGTLAADTLMIKGNTIFGHVEKIVRRESDGALCGGAGNLGWVQAFHRWFLEGEEGDPPPLGEYDNGIIVRKDNPEVEIFEDAGAWCFTPNYTAIGSGKEFALAAMGLGTDAETAIKTAMQFDPGTGGEVMVLRHEQ